MTFIPHVIDGQESESASGARFASVDPWTREPYAEVALGGEQDADRAVRAARRAFDEGPWPRMGFAERGALLHRWVNCFFVRDLRAPFGGVGDSGIGREGGTFSREFFTEPKAVVMEI